MYAQEMRIVDLHPYRESANPQFHYGVFTMEDGQVLWFDGSTPLHDLPPSCLWFRVNRVENDVRVVLEDDRDAHIDGQTYRFQLTLSDHTPEAVVKIAGNTMEDIINGFAPMDMVHQLEQFEDMGVSGRN